MERLCGRPGCSERASVAYGMRAEDLVFWLDALSGDESRVGGVLCRRHADSMVVPRGWTLDDLRDPDLHLFRPPPPSPTVRRRPRAVRQVADDYTGEQLRLGDDVIAAADIDVAEVPNGQPAAAATAQVATTEVRTEASTPDDAPGPWTPAFDEADDLGGLLSARSPLLSRAFRTADRADE